MITQNIKAKAMCVLEKNGRFLVSQGHDDVKNETFYRILGGHLDFGERAEEGVRREIREELGSELENLKFLTVIENIFTYNGKPGHEIVFLYSGELADKNLYEKESVIITEPNQTLEAVWVIREDILTDKIKVYPSFDYKRILN